MPKDGTAARALRPFGMLKVFGSIGALPRNPRTMHVYDVSLAWTAILLALILGFLGLLCTALLTIHFFLG